MSTEVLSNQLDQPAPEPNESDSGRAIVLKALLELGHRDVTLSQELEGGASTRRFFRLKLGGKPVIAMYTPAPSQEIAKARQSTGYASFVEVAALLSAHGLPVPQIIAASGPFPVLLVEDLGDFTLANYLVAHEQAKLSLYRKAVSTLALAQLRIDPLPNASVVRTRAFDFELLLWEVEHFKVWALHARGIKLSPAEEDIFNRSAQYLSQTIAGWKRGFVHRDYQSRNIMVQGELGHETLTWIDFQDAMMGPRVYDLVALLTDSYQTFSPEFVSERLTEYCELRGCSAERELVEQEFYLVTVQRKLKDAGRFIFLDRVNRNSHFLQFVDPTIIKARRALALVSHLGPLSELQQLLEHIFGHLSNE